MKKQPVKSLSYHLFHAEQVLHQKKLAYVKGGKPVTYPVRVHISTALSGRHCKNLSRFQDVRYVEFANADSKPEVKTNRIFHPSERNSEWA